VQSPIRPAPTEKAAALHWPSRPAGHDEPDGNNRSDPDRGGDFGKWTEGDAGTGRAIIQSHFASDIGARARAVDAPQVYLL
jgi:hypothetical protein